MSGADDHIGGRKRVAALAGRAHLTEGQLYSGLITLAAAALLATGLGNVHGVAGVALSQPPLEAPANPPTVVAPAPVPETAGQAAPLAPPAGVGAPAPVPASAPAWMQPAGPGDSGFGLTPTSSPSTPTGTPCDKQAVQDAGTQVVVTANGLSGGRLPQKDLLAALGTVTGCRPSNPAILALGLLIGLGQTVPDPGLPAPPPLPFVEIPAPAVSALQPVRPEIDAVCGVLGLGNELTALFIWAYPTPVPQSTAQAFFQALAACGQVRKP